MSFLSLQGLSRQWDDTLAADNISVDIQEGEFIALLGPSGCGKSTTLKLIAGLDTPSGGRILLKGEDITGRAPGQRQLSMVFQSYALFPHLNVRENILFGLKARKVPVEEQNRRLAKALELVDLGEHVRKKPAQLSGGQCQRVALARAIVSQAPLCLMDEPLSNLDAKLRNEMRSEIRALQKRLGLTVVYVTHDQVEAMSMADRIVLLNAGRIEQIGTPRDLYHTPASLFVAGFIGHPPMNLLADGDRQRGIRPEDIRLANESETGIAMDANVLYCDYQGADTLITVDIQGAPVTLSLQGHHQLPAGQPLAVAWDRRDEHHFSRQTGLRLSPPLQPPQLKESSYVEVR